MIKKTNVISRCLFFLLTVFILFPQTDGPASVSDVYKLNLQADEFFARNEYDKALEYYRDVDKYAALFPTSKQYLNQYMYGIPQVDLVKQHRNLLPLKPEFVHSMLIVYIQNTSVWIEDRAGRRLVQNSISDDEIARSEIAQEIFKKYVEVLSGGEVSIRFTRITLNSTLTNLIVNSSKNYQNEPLETKKADFHGLTPFNREQLLPLFDAHDSVVFFWNDKDISGRPTGELVHIPIVPYQLIGNKRGFIQMPIAYRTAGTLLHEFFHCLEDMYYIYPRHGFLEGMRYKYPAWSGTDQWDYYKFHFETTIKSYGWERFLFAHFYPFSMTQTIIEKNERLIQNVPEKEQKEAFKNYLDADRIFTSDIKQAVALLKDAIKKNPHLAPALTLLAQHAGSINDGTQFYALLEKSYEINPFHYKTLYLLGTAWGKRQNYEQALSYLSQAIEIAPLYSKSYFYRGFVYYRLKDGIHALEDYRRYIILEPGQKESILNFYSKPAQKGDSIAQDIIAGLQKIGNTR